MLDTSGPPLANANRRATLIAVHGELPRHVRNIVTQLLTIQLPDGLSTEMDESEWLQLASANCHRLTEKGYFDSDLIVRKHSDDRTLVYVVIKNPEGDTTASGELLLPGTTDVESHILRVARQFDLSKKAEIEPQPAPEPQILPIAERPPVTCAGTCFVP